MEDDAETCEILLETGIDINAIYNNATLKGGNRDAHLIHWAIRYDAVSITKVRHLSVGGFEVFLVVDQRGCEY